LFNPGDQDTDIQTAQTIALTVAVTAGSAATGGLAAQAAGGLIKALGGGLIAVGAGGGLAGGVAGDVAAQLTFIGLGMQQNYNPIQTIISGGLGLLGGAVVAKFCPGPPVPPNCFVADTLVLTDEAVYASTQVVVAGAEVEDNDPAPEEESAFLFRVGVVCILLGLAIGIKCARSSHDRGQRRDRAQSLAPGASG
jgi:hypothetical protein